MTARYRLPAELGGGEYEAAEVGASEIRLAVPGVGLVTVSRHVVTKVEPAPEPANLTVLRAIRAVYQRDDSDDVTIPAGQWWMVGRNRSMDWASIAHLQFEELVPAPDPVELPWTSDGVHVQQTTDEGKPSNQVYVSTRKASYGFAHVTPTLAREMARALWTAADAAEAQS